MAEKVSFFDLSKEESEAFLAKGVGKRLQEMHAKKIPTTHADENGIYRLLNDEKTYL